MKVKINGEHAVFEQPLTVAELLAVHRVEMPEYVTVQINEEIIDRQDFAVKSIREGDEIEFLYYMGGGRQ